MNSQGFLGALEQYWTINEKPRLDRRNTFFEDTTVSNTDALRFGLLVSTIAIAIIGFWSVLGVIL
jgi:hypothetical protein